MLGLKKKILEQLRGAVEQAQREGALPPGSLPDVEVERPQNPGHGDLATSLPLRAARAFRVSPMAIAEAIASRLPALEELEPVTVAPPGFINFTLRTRWLQEQVHHILSQGEAYGDLELGAGQRVLVEFVSVNPTGPVHVGHVRGAVLGSTLARVLEAAGYRVTREYYVNDSGSQMEVFYRSVWIRYQQVLGRDVEMPPGGYMGTYVVDLAREIHGERGDHFLRLDETEAIREIGEVALERMVQAIREDLGLIGVDFHVWFRERDLYQDSAYQKAMSMIRNGGYVAEREGARWFVSTALGEDKDNVLVRSSGAPTYFASDIAYHYDKFLTRRFERAINIWGADHQGHVSRVKAAVVALGVDPRLLDVIIVQMVTLKRGGEVVRASKRTGELVTLRELVEEVGRDACRYFFSARSADAQMEFDLDLAKRESQENPVYYIQYAHARIAGILRNAREKGLQSEEGDVSLLNTGEEMDLIRKLVLLPELVETVSATLEPHHLAYYALEVATAFHWFYDHCRVIGEDPADQDLVRARLKLVEACRIVLARTLHLMGMTAPQRM
ncbi:MAG: arginine--tRNA ligase [Chloroflexi bacterium]|nr:arginine--tRNA ligase [Chloroflexota bacterium]